MCVYTTMKCNDKIKQKYKKTVRTSRAVYQKNQKMSYIGFLARLIEEEVLSKTDRSINRKRKISKNYMKYNFVFQPSINDSHIGHLPI